MRFTPDYFYSNVEIAQEIHAAAITGFGGSDGVREIALLESAIAAPQATSGGQSPYADAIEIAAAYLFYLCRTQPFIDGNKGTALGACLVFLRLNGIQPSRDGSSWEELTLAVAFGSIERDETTKRLRQLIASPTS